MSRTIDKIRATLDQPLDYVNGEVLMLQLTEIEAWSGWLAERAGAYKKILSERRGQYTFKLPDTKETVDQMKARAERAVASDQQNYDDYAELLAIVRTRLSLGQSLLRNKRSEVEAGLR